MRLAKLHALGNDFVVLVDLAGVRPVDAALAQRLCDRRRGVGADGVVRACPGAGGADVTMELRNADGGLAETSGNGLRCLAHALARRSGAAPGASWLVLTGAGPRRATLVDLPDPATALVRAEMGPAKVVPAAGVEGWRAAEVDVGNLHLVLVVDDVGTLDLAALGRHFPDRNVEVVVPDQGEAATVRVWERGVGETPACGSGAVAVAVALGHWGLAGDRLAVRMPGGVLEVSADGEGWALLGPSVHVADLEVPWL